MTDRQPSDEDYRSATAAGLTWRQWKDRGGVHYGVAIAKEEADTRALERTEQHACYMRLRAYGFKVYNLSQARETKQAAGLADAWIVHVAADWAGWWETKRQKGGRYSEDQLAFQEECRICGVKYATGDRFTVNCLLVELGLATMDDEGNLEPTHRYRLTLL